MSCMRLVQRFSRTLLLFDEDALVAVRNFSWTQLTVF
jgi:hypothetical protein